MISFLLWAISLASLTSQAPLQSPNSLRLAIQDNFPDPAFVKVGDTFYAFATNNGKQNVPVAISKDFVNWDVTGEDALPDVPSWSGGVIWAPDVVQLVPFPAFFLGVQLADKSRLMDLSSCTWLPSPSRIAPNIALGWQNLQDPLVPTYL